MFYQLLVNKTLSFMNNRPMFYQLIVNKNTIFYDRKPEAAMAVGWAPDDGHCNARNMLSSVGTTKQ